MAGDGGQTEIAVGSGSSSEAALQFDSQPQNSEMYGQADFTQIPEGGVRQALLPEATTSPYLQLQTIRNTTMNTVMREVIRLHDESGWVPNLETAKALTCRWAQWNREYRRNSFYYGDAGNFITNMPSIPWPKQCLFTRGKVIHDGQKTWFENDYDDAILVKNSKSFGDVHVGDPSDDPGDQYRWILRTILNKMPTHDRLELSAYLVGNIEAFVGKFQDDYVYCWDLLDFGLGGLDFKDYNVLKQANEVGLGKAVTDIYVSKEGRFSTIRDVLKGYNLDRLLYETIALNEYSDADIRQAMGTRMKKNGIGRELNVLREFLLDEAHEPLDKRSRVENLVRHVMGLSEDKPVARSLVEFYSWLTFENYTLSRAIEQYRPEWLKNLFERYNIDQTAEIGDWACGTGWLTAGLQELGYTNIGGMDINEGYIDKAKQLYPKARSTFIVGDYTHPELPPNSQDVILILGRTTHHLDLDAMYNMLEEARKCLKPEGVIIFDRADPKRGSYRSFLTRFRKVLHQFGYSVKELMETYHTVDSPDGEHFMDRDVSPEDRLLGIILGVNLIPEVYYEDNFNGHGDRNMVFVCRKPKTEPRSHRWSRKKENTIIAHTPRRDASEIYPFTPPT